MLINSFVKICFTIFIVAGSCYAELKGSVWPKPQEATTYEETYPVAVELFTFTLDPNSHSCNILTEAFTRYEKLIKSSFDDGHKVHFRPRSASFVTTLSVKLNAECEHLPHEDMNEAYTLSIGRSNLLYSESLWGILRGLETFSQILWKSGTGEVMMNQTNIVDAPRFSFRGIMIDTSRHYLPTSVIFETLNIMAWNKFNVLHWHIVDDQSFPFVSTTYPNLHKKGAFNPSTHIYTPEDVAAIIEYARLRGIRVVPEFDSPGHSQSWGKSQQDLLTPCYTDGKPNGKFGPINPTEEKNYEFVRNLWTELRRVFKDKYIHLGGDEVSFNCWKSNPEITKHMAAENITGDYSKLEQEYIQKVIDISNDVGFSYIVWQEVIDNGIQAKKDTVVDVWKGPIEQELAKVTKMGYKVLISHPWYLNIIGYGQDWRRYYQYEPTKFDGTDEQKKLILGGEACIWGEYVDATNIISRLWPRASAVGERLWSSIDVNDVDEAFPRLHNHRCRMLSRGIPAEPVYIGHCEHEWRNT